MMVCSAACTVFKYLPSNGADEDDGSDGSSSSSATLHKYTQFSVQLHRPPFPYLLLHTNLFPANLFFFTFPVHLTTHTHTLLPHYHRDTQTQGHQKQQLKVKAEEGKISKSKMIERKVSTTAVSSIEQIETDHRHGTTKRATDLVVCVCVFIDV